MPEKKQRLMMAFLMCFCVVLMTVSKLAARHLTLHHHQQRLQPYTSYTIEINIDRAHKNCWKHAKTKVGYIISATSDTGT